MSSAVTVFLARRRPGTLALALLLSIVSLAAAKPADKAQSIAVDLPLASDRVLQRDLEDIVRRLGLWRFVGQQQLALGLVDITDINRPRFAALNADQMMYAASLPKIAILLGAYVEIAAGKLEADQALRDDMVAMIRYSNNAAATRVLARVGRKDLIGILTSRRLHLYDQRFNGGLWVGKDYARKPAFRRDPLHNLSHGATVRQVARFFYLLEKGTLVPQPNDQEMKEILSKPVIQHKFVAGLKNRPNARLFRKSGTWREFHADAALVESGRHRYILVGLAHHPDGGKWLVELAAPLHDLIVGDESEASRTARLESTY